MNMSKDQFDANQNTLALEVGARLEREPSNLLTEVAFGSELNAQSGLNSAISLVDLAHTLCTIESDTVPRQSGIELIRALLELHTQPESFAPTPNAGDLYTNREAWLAQRTDAVAWFGCGRARREATTAAYLITIRTKLFTLNSAVIELAASAVALAAEHQNSLMPDYTYLQAAQPTSFGHYLLGFVYPMLRDLDRIAAAFNRVNASPLGGGSTNGSRYSYDRNAAAKMLGFDSVAIHARDSMWQADLPIELGALLSASIINADRLAEDLQVFATQEFGLIELCDSHSRASKIMPQKKNPFALTHIRSVANEIIGTVTSLSMSARTPSGQPDNRTLAYGQLPVAIEKVTGALSLMRDVLQELHFNTERGVALVTPATLATDLADALVIEASLAPRSAHRLVGQLVREHSGGLASLTVDDISAAAQQLWGRAVTLSPENLQMALDPRHALAVRETTGGSGPNAMTAMFEQCLVSIETHREWLNTTQEQLDEAERVLIERAKMLIEK
jgi:argininosuccinate lyase